MGSTTPARSSVIYDGADGVPHAFVATPVPEPSVLALSGVAGLAGLGYSWRRGAPRSPRSGTGPRGDASPPRSNRGTTEPGVDALARFASG